MSENSATSPPNICGTGRPALFHYTDFFGLSGIVSSKSIWCSKIQYLNDFRELIHGLEVLANETVEHVKAYPALSDMNNRIRQLKSINVFVCSLSEDADVLSQWRGYAGGGGVSVGLRYEKLLQKASAQGFTLEKCVYDSAEKRSIAREYLRHAISKLNSSNSDENTSFRIASNFIPIAARFKDQGFREENEWRLISPILRNGTGKISARATDGGLIPYTSFTLSTSEQPFLSETQPWRTHEYMCIDEVKIGPNREQELQMSSVGDLFDSNHVALKGVSRSAIPYRSL